MTSAFKWVMEDAFRIVDSDYVRDLRRARMKLPTGTLHLLPADSPRLGVLGAKVKTWLCSDLA